MSFYNLRPKGTCTNLTDMEIYYCSSSYYAGEEFNRYFNIYAKELYYYAKSLPNGDAFVNELDELCEKFYDIIYRAVEKGEIKLFYTKEECDKPGYAPYEKDLKLIYDRFLPL